MVANLLAHMKPPVDPPEPVADKPGYYRLKAPGLAKESSVTYYVQLPPEYDPYRLYPTIVTLHGAGPNAERQVDWWAGEWKGDTRTARLRDTATSSWPRYGPWITKSSTTTRPANTPPS